MVLVPLFRENRKCHLVEEFLIYVCVSQLKSPLRPISLKIPGKKLLEECFTKGILKIALFFSCILSQNMETTKCIQSRLRFL